MQLARWVLLVPRVLPAQLGPLVQQDLPALRAQRERLGPPVRLAQPERMAQASASSTYSQLPPPTRIQAAAA